MSGCIHCLLEFRSGLLGFFDFVSSLFRLLFALRLLGNCFGFHDLFVCLYFLLQSFLYFLGSFLLKMGGMLLGLGNLGVSLSLRLLGRNFGFHHLFVGLSLDDFFSFSFLSELLLEMSSLLLFFGDHLCFSLLLLRGSLFVRDLLLSSRFFRFSFLRLDSLLGGDFLCFGLGFDCMLLRHGF